MQLKQQLQDEMKNAMRSQAKARLGTIRLIQAAIKQKEVDEQKSLDDTEVLQVLDKMLKQRRDSIQQYQQAERADLVEKEQAEMQVIQQFMPAQLNETEIAAEIEAAMSETNANSIKDMGKLMACLKSKLQGRADMAAVSQMIKAKLSA